MTGKKLSGAQFRKRAAQKQLEEEKLLKKVPKISGFFSAIPPPEVSLQSSDNIDNDKICLPTVNAEAVDFFSNNSKIEPNSATKGNEQDEPSSSGVSVEVSNNLELE